MNLLGIGIDLVEVSRLEGAVQRRGEDLARRLFTIRELEEAASSGGRARWSTLAGKWAAKEAVVKAMGTGFRAMAWKDVEVTRDELGKPRVALSGGAAALAKELGVTGFLVSITHERGFAAASAAAVGDGRGARKDRPEPRGVFHAD